MVMTQFDAAGEAMKAEVYVRRSALGTLDEGHQEKRPAARTRVVLFIARFRHRKFYKISRAIFYVVSTAHADTPQFREGNPYFFSENPYQSVSFIYASMYCENVHAILIAMQFAKKSRHCVIKIDSQQQRTKIGAILHVARQSD